MKKILLVLLSCLMLITFVACGDTVICSRCGSENANRITAPNSGKSMRICDDCIEEIGQTEEGIRRNLDRMG